MRYRGTAHSKHLCRKPTQGLSYLQLWMEEERQSKDPTAGQGKAFLTLFKNWISAWTKTQAPAPSYNACKPEPPLLQCNSLVRVKAEPPLLSSSLLFLLFLLFLIFLLLFTLLCLLIFIVSDGRCFVVSGRGETKDDAILLE
eukprot:g75814.t1